MVDRFERFSKGVSELSKYWHKIAADEMEKYGLKGCFAQYLLAMARRPEGIPAAELCRICDKDKAAISRTLAELEEAGMVIRESRNGSKYRASLMLTQQGQVAAEAVVEKARLAVEKAGTGFGEEEREVFYRVMAIIAGNLHNLCQVGLSND
jgi:DNA-binding MarR family transcriptional regulator